MTLHPTSRRRAPQGHLFHCACAPYFALRFIGIRQLCAAGTALFGSVNGQIKQARQIMNSVRNCKFIRKKPESAVFTARRRMEPVYDVPSGAGEKVSHPSPERSVNEATARTRERRLCAVPSGAGEKVSHPSPERSVNGATARTRVQRNAGLCG